jgi:hypothetical protein
MQHPAMMSAHLTSPHEPVPRHQQASRTLDEAMSAGCLSLILASAVSLQGSGHIGLSWFSFVGVPVWCTGRAALVL